MISTSYSLKCTTNLFSTLMVLSYKLFSALNSMEKLLINTDVLAHLQQRANLFVRSRQTSSLQTNWLRIIKEILCNWPGSSKCCFCEQNESTEHLFINCPFAKIIWQIVYMAFNITPPINIAHMFGAWLNGIVKSEKRNIRVGVCAILTAIWHVRNDFIFNKACFPTFL
jgi:hypothetical protein